jgi:uncharacterized membrane protein (DUF106 family)
MWTFHRALGALVDGLLYPFRTLPAIVGLTVVALIVSVGILLVFRTASDQEALAAVKRRIHAGVFEIRLFKDDPRAILGAQADILRDTLTYFRLSMIPMLWALLPLVLLLIQLQFHYGYEGLEEGQPAIVSVQLSDEWLAAVTDVAEPDILLETPPGVRVETPLLWIPSLGVAEWRVRVDRPGAHTLNVRLGEDTFEKSLLSTGEIARHSPLRPSSNLRQQLLYPTEPPLPAGAAVQSIAVSLKAADVTLFGVRTHWLIAFFVLTLIIALPLQRPLGVRL